MNSNMMVPTTTTMTTTTITNVTTRRQEVSSSSLSLTTVAVHVRVQKLNNLGCIYVLKGKHLEAKCTFELALQLLQSEGREGGRRATVATAGVVGVHDSTIYDYGYYGTNNNDEEFDQSTLLPSAGNTATNPSFSSSVCRDDDDGHNNDTIKRMTTTSRLCTFPYSGQHQYKQDSKKTKNSTITNTTTNNNQEYYHQIYCLPIVMDDDEWALASMEGKSLVLIFNTALSFHLLGISSYLSLSSIVQVEQEDNNNHNLFRRQQYHQCLCNFQAAKKNYTVVLESIRTLFECGVNRLCHIAIFNNVSHLCKSLASGSQHVREFADYYNEAYAYDIVLLKAIYWYRDSNDDSSNRTSGMNSDHSANNSSSSSSSGSSDNPDYTESDVEIIDSFLENVFYLMGAPENTVPASAA